MRSTTTTNALPDKGVLFLGGHQNMTKKLRQQFPKWTYVTDDQLRRCTNLNQNIVFFWTGHSSHKLTHYVYSKLPDNANIIYVNATNLPLLIAQMQNTYSAKIHPVLGGFCILGLSPQTKEDRSHLL